MNILRQVDQDEKLPKVLLVTVKFYTILEKQISRLTYNFSDTNLSEKYFVVQRIPR